MKAKDSTVTLSQVRSPAPIKFLKANFIANMISCLGVVLFITDHFAIFKRNNPVQIFHYFLIMSCKQESHL